MRGRIIAHLKTVWMTAEGWERVATKHAFRVFGDVTMLSWIIIGNGWGTPRLKTWLVQLQYS